MIRRVRRSNPIASEVVNHYRNVFYEARIRMIRIRLKACELQSASLQRSAISFMLPKRQLIFRHTKIDSCQAFGKIPSGRANNSSR